MRRKPTNQMAGRVLMTLFNIFDEAFLWEEKKKKKKKQSKTFN